MLSSAYFIQMILKHTSAIAVKKLQFINDLLRKNNTGLILPLWCHSCTCIPVMLSWMWMIRGLKILRIFAVNKSSSICLKNRDRWQFTAHIETTHSFCVSWSHSFDATLMNMCFISTTGIYLTQIICTEETAKHLHIRWMEQQSLRNHFSLTSYSGKPG